MTQTRMSGVDAAWLHMDRALNRLIVNSVLCFDEPVDPGELRRLVAERLVARYPRFHQRVVDRTTSVWWRDDPDFVLDEHLVHARLPAPGDRAALEEFLADRLSERLPRDRPLWQFTLVDGYGSGCALISRIHHCIADGVALSRVLLSLTDGAPADGRIVGAGTRLQHGDAAHRGAAALLDPRAWPQLGRDARSAGRALARLTTLPPDARTQLRSAPLGGRKTGVWGEGFALAELAGAAHARGVTVNDLLLAALAGALRRHLARADGHVPDIRAVVPINVRDGDAPLPADLGNEFGLLYATLPTSVDDPLERLARTHDVMTDLKHSAEPLVSLRLLELTGHAPYEAAQVVVELFAMKASLVVTNVPGPRTPVFLAGREVRETVGWPPESGRLGLGVSFISYAGSLRVGLLSDDRRVPDPHRLLADIGTEITSLLPPEGDAP